MTPQSKILKRVGTDFSPFDLRLICRISELTLKSIGAKKYLSALNRFTQYILENRSILPQKMLLQFDLIQCTSLTQLYDSLEQISDLPFHKFLLISSTKELDQKYSDIVSNFFGFISAHIKDTRDLAGAKLLMDAVQEKHDVKYHLNLEVTDFKNIELVTNFLEQVIEKKHYDITISGNEEKIKEKLDHILERKRHLGKLVRDNDHHTYGYNELCVLEDDSISSLDEIGFLQQPYQTKGYMCQMGSSSIATDPVGRIKTSFCSQTRKIGILFWPETYKNNLPLSPYLCEQNSCQDFFDRLIKKSSPIKKSDK